MYNIGVR